MRRKTSSIVAVAASALMLSSSARALTISSGNSSLTLNPATSNHAFAHFATAWTVDGINEFGGSTLGHEDFTLDLGPSAGQPLNQYNVISSSTSAGQATTTYGSAGNFSLNYTAIVAGGAAGSGKSSIDETFTFKNLGTQAFTFFLLDDVQYSVDGNSTNNLLNLTPSATPDTATQTSGNATIKFISSQTPSLFFLSNNGTPVTGTGPVTGTPGFQFSWQFPVDPGATASLSINETLIGGSVSTKGSGGPGPTGVPLPSSAAACATTFAGMALVGFVRRGRRRNRTAS
jgi:hypothetical protein